MIQSLSDDQQEELMRLMVTRNIEINEPQGLGNDIFLAFEAWSVISACYQTSAPPVGIVGDALLRGNAYILIIMIGKLLDKGRKRKHSIKSIWNEYEAYIHSSITEKKFIREALNHPEKCHMLSYVIKLRHEAFAHNVRVITSLGNL